MLLIKCKCGCFFTVKNESVCRDALRCQNCLAEIPLVEQNNIPELKKAMFSAGAAVSAVPDNAKITVEFNA